MMEKPTPVQRAEIRALSWARTKQSHGKKLSAYEARLIVEDNERQGTPEGNMIAYWAAGPNRPVADHAKWTGEKPAFCGQCVMLDLTPLDSGIRYCRDRCVWRRREDEACDRGQLAVSLERALVDLTYAVDAWLYRLDGYEDEYIPF